jgi:mannose/fructose-specific phosphotransferase system component IIA
MPSTYTTNLGIEKIATGEQSGTWGNTTNTNLDILDQSIDGIISITLVSAGSSGSPNSLPITDGAVSNGRNKFIEFVDGGDLGATAYVQLTPNDAEKIVHIRNSLSASRSIIVFQGTYNASNDYEILNGEDVLLKFDGAGAGAVVSQVFANLALPSVNIDGGTIDGAVIGGGTIDGAVIGGASAAAGSFTTLSASSPISAADGSALTPSITNTGDTNTGIFFPAADTVGVAVGGTEVWRYGSNPTTAKSLLINGAMMVSQRGVNATIVTGFDSTTNSYIADRFLASGNGSPQNRADLKHVSSGGPTGFPNFIRYDITTAESAVAAGEASIIQHRMEGFNLQSIQAASGVVALTLQFYMRSPKTGTHCVYLSTQNTRNIVKEFTVASADTWEKHTVSFIADTSGGTVSNAATEFLRVGWPIIAGTTYQGTADAWTASNIFATSNQQNLADNTANNIDITGVQLEVGSVATDFEHEDIGTTLAKCKRYLFRLEGTSANVAIGQGYCQSSTEFRARIRLPVEMRATPTGSQSGAGATSVNVPAGRIAATGTSTSGASKYMGTLVITTAGSLTTGQGGTLEIDTTSDWVQWSAEL